MKRRRILNIAIIPVIVFTMAAFTNLQPGKDKKDNKGNKSQDKEKSESDHKPDHQKGDKDSRNNHQGEEKNGNGKHGQNHKNEGNGNSSRMENKNSHASKEMDHGNGNSHKMNGERGGDIDWNLNDFSNRKHPKDQKKVTICHKPSSDGDNGVTISVSENALKAHMNHGDERGDCKNNNAGRWSDNYIKSRENVFNTYEQSWERMSYGEALVRLAANKILGLKSNLDQNRSSLSAQEIQRREALIYDLENNTNSVNTQLGVTRQRLDSDVNIIIKL
jgi:hypothetical protein